MSDLHVEGAVNRLTAAVLTVAQVIETQRCHDHRAAEDNVQRMHSKHLKYVLSDE